MTDTENPVGTTVHELVDGGRIPLIGLGVWQVPNGAECVDSVAAALDAGYRHIDTAQAYENEESVGKAIKESGIAREDIYITTKFLPNLHDPEEEAKRSLDRLGVDYVDLYIVHWPKTDATWAWDGMQRAHGNGYARSIGVSNFSAAEIDTLLTVADTKPQVNQVQFNPFKYRAGLLQHCAEHGIALEAYSPLGTGKHLEDPTVGKIADRLGRTPAQILIRWCLQRDVIVLPKSTHKERIESNADVFGFELSEEDMATLDGLDETGGTDQAQETKWW